MDVNYLSAEFPDQGLYLRAQDYVSLGIPAKIYDRIFLWRAKKNTDGGKVFRFMKLEESMVRDDSKPEKTCSELAGTHFTIEKEIPIKNSGVQKVRNWINCRIPRNSEQISQLSNNMCSRCCSSTSFFMKQETKLYHQW